MTNTQHTQGPWLVEPDARVGSITVTHTSEGLRSHIAVLPSMTLCEEHGNLLANARLIAAAPDMLKCLWDVLPKLLHGSPEWKIVHDAIAKARGQS